MTQTLQTAKKKKKTLENLIIFFFHYLGQFSQHCVIRTHMTTKSLFGFGGFFCISLLNYFSFFFFFFFFFFCFCKRLFCFMKRKCVVFFCFSFSLSYQTPSFQHWSLHQRIVLTGTQTNLLACNSVIPICTPAYITAPHNKMHSTSKL